MAAEILSCEMRELNDMFFESFEETATSEQKVNVNGENTAEASTNVGINESPSSPESAHSPTPNVAHEEDKEKAKDDGLDAQAIASSIVQCIVENAYQEPVIEKSSPAASPEPEKTKPKEEAKPANFPLLEQLFSVLNEPEINPVLAGYFLKVFEILLEKKQIDLMNYLFAHKQHITRLLYHVYDKSISEVVKKVVSNEDRYFSGTTGEEFLYEKMEIIDLLIDHLGPSNPTHTILNSGAILTGLIEGRQHLAYFNEPKILKRVFVSLTSLNSGSLCAGIAYITALLKLNVVATSPRNSGDQLCFMGLDNFQQVEPKIEEELDYTEIMSLATEKLGYFKGLLLSGGNGIKYDTQFGGQIVPFGNDRLKVIDFLQILMQTKNDIFCQKFDELEMPSVLMTLLKEYYMNSLLHVKIYNIFSDSVHSSIDFLIDMVLC